MVLAIIGITLGVPDFEDMVSLGSSSSSHLVIPFSSFQCFISLCFCGGVIVGGLVNSMMGFVLPPILHLKLHGSSLSNNQFWGHVGFSN